MTASQHYSPQQIAAWAQIDESRWKEKLAKSQVRVAVINAQPVGFITRIGHYIDMLFVEPEYTRRGVASALLKPLIIKQGMGSQAMGPISVMESEHDEAGELLEVIKHTTNNVTPPPEACTTWKAMYNGINELIDDLMEHISLENNVLFPRALAGE